MLRDNSVQGTQKAGTFARHTIVENKGPLLRMFLRPCERFYEKYFRENKNAFHRASQVDLLQIFQ